MSKSIVELEQDFYNHFLNMDKNSYGLIKIWKYLEEHVFSQFKETDEVKTNWELEAKRAWRKIEIYKDEADRYKNHEVMMFLKKHLKPEMLNTEQGVQECDASKAQSMGEPMAQNKSAEGQQLTECYVPVSEEDSKKIGYNCEIAFAKGWIQSPDGWLKKINHE
jgi:hypothetical protein